MDIFAKIASGGYTVVGLIHIQKPSKPTILYRKIGEMTPAQINEAVKAKEEYDARMEDFRANAQYWRDATAKMNVQFYHDIAEEHNLHPLNPKFAKLYDIAWDMGHSAGYSEIYNYVLRLLPLIQD